MRHAVRILRPGARPGVVSSRLTACDDAVAAALVHVEEALMDEACFLEIVGSRPRVIEVLSAAGLSSGRHGPCDPADLTTIDCLLDGARRRADRPAAAVCAVLQLAGPTCATCRVRDRRGESLMIGAHHGLDEPFLTYFARVADDTSACGAAMGRGELVVVDDVARDRIFVGTPGLDVMLEAGARAVESMPYLSPAGQVAGVISMHHRMPGVRPKRELMLLRLIAGRLGALWG